MVLPRVWLAVLAGSLSAWVPSVAATAASPVVLVTGATGRTGSLLYKAFQERGATVRALVRNASKARGVLGCSKCDASEGIFVGDVSKVETLVPAMQGATALAITTSAVLHCGAGGCTYPEGGFPIDIDWNGQVNQISAFASVTKGMGSVALLSTMGTTDPNGALEKWGNGHMAFYKMNGEAYLMSSGVPYTIVKGCPLTNDPGGELELVVGHNDMIKLTPQKIPRADVATVLMEAVLNPSSASGLRFDMCSRKGTPTSDFDQLFKDARYPWQKFNKDTVHI